MAEEDEDKTAFFAREGIFCYQKMPFGLKIARATYQRLVDKVFSDQIGRNLEAYVDDLVIKSISKEDMLKDIQETFEKFQSINMKLNPKKCFFGIEKGPFLGTLLPSKVLAKRSIDNKEVLQVEVKEEESWMTPIYEYLLSSLLPGDLREPRKIRIEAPQYKLIKGSLYKKSFFTPWLRYIAPSKNYKARVLLAINVQRCREGNTKPYKMQGTIYGQKRSRERSNSIRKHMIIQPLGSQHSKTPTNCPRRFKVSGNSSRALYKMGRRKATNHYKRETG
nr:hypothetical protein [Tanacetum cinerariifolium]